MPLMPAPPMPTKWTRLTLCFIAWRAGGRVRPPGASRRSCAACAPRPPCAAGARGPARPATRQPRGREVALQPHLGGATALEHPRVVDLVVVRRVRERDEQARDTHGRELRDRGRAAAADDDVRFGIAARDVVDEWQAFGDDAGARVGIAQGVDVALAGLVRDERTGLARHERQRLRHRLVQRERALAAAHDEDLERARAPGESFLRRRAPPRSRRAADCRPIRRAASGPRRARRGSRSARGPHRAAAPGWRGPAARRGCE